MQNHNHYHLKMPVEFNKILKDNQGRKSMKIPFVTYADTVSPMK